MKLTVPQRAALEALYAGRCDTAEIAKALPRGHWGEPTVNRAHKLLVRLEARGLCDHLGVGQTRVWYLTNAGREALV